METLSFVFTVRPHTQPHLDISSGFVRDLHDKLAPFAIRLAHQMVQYKQVYSGAQVIDVGDENVLLPFSDELLEQTGVIKASVNIAVTGRIPHIRILSSHSHILCNRQQGFLVNTWIPGEKGVNKIKMCHLFTLMSCKLYLTLSSLVQNRRYF